MAITNFIPTIWSENLNLQLDNKYVGVNNCNRAYEGDIKEMGSVVKICGIENIYVSDYYKNSDMSQPQTLSDTVIEFEIDQAKYFNFQIDDVDRAQATPKLMEAAMSTAAAALARSADSYIFSMCTQANTLLRANTPTSDELIDIFMKAITTLYDNGVSDASQIVIEVSPQVAADLIKAKIELGTNNSEAFENGQIGTLFGAKVFVSNNICTYIEESEVLYNCMVRSKRAIAFAEQLSEIEAYRPEKRFSDAVKGLHLYGAKVIYPHELVCVEITKPLEY